MTTRRLILAALGLVVLAGAFLAGGILIGERTASADDRAAGRAQP
ncbi:MAG: hypothetical protein QOD04_6634, partial [Pseudonocardiales bacterium]|nr:hypothetical protein [Pseudonocardiales bacterium]